MRCRYCNVPHVSNAAECANCGAPLLTGGRRQFHVKPRYTTESANVVPPSSWHCNTIAAGWAR